LNGSLAKLEKLAVAPKIKIPKVLAEFWQPVGGAEKIVQRVRVTTVNEAKCPQR